MENGTNDADNAYLYDTTAGREHDELCHNMQMVCYIKEEKNVNRNNLIDMSIFKLTTGNAMKQLRI